MKKSAIVLYVVAGLFLVSGVAAIPSGDFQIFIGGVIIAAALAFFGYRQQKKPLPGKQPAEAPKTLSASMYAETKQQIEDIRSKTPTKKYVPVDLPESIGGKVLKYKYDDVKLAMSDDRQTPVSIGATVTFEHESDNSYDENAVAAYVDGVHIGYLHRGRLQDMFHDYTEGGGEVHGRIKAIELDEKISVLIGYYKNG